MAAECEKVRTWKEYAVKKEEVSELRYIGLRHSVKMGKRTFYRFRLLIHTRIKF